MPVGDFAAAVSRVPAEEFTPEVLETRLQDLEWVGERGIQHECVVTWFVDRGSILPARLLTLYSSRAALEEEARSRRGRIERGLRGVAGRREWDLKISFDAELIFEDFSQVGEFSTREHGGTGLGLSICRKLVGLMKGTIEVRSEFGEGTCFTLHLPLRVDPGSPEEEALRALIPPRDGVRRAEVEEVERPLRRSPLSGDR
ncbi:MAG: GvpL/GvpF family gas vesicle protein [Gemmatimonadota bacterium]